MEKTGLNVAAARRPRRSAAEKKEMPHAYQKENNMGIYSGTHPEKLPIPYDPAELDREPQQDMPRIDITIGIAVALTGEYAEPYGLPMNC